MKYRLLISGLLILAGCYLAPQKGVLRIHRSAAITAMAPVTVYPECNYGGYAVNLGVGSYTLTQLEALGVEANELSSASVAPGYQLALYSGDHFSGTSVKLASDDACLTDKNFNDMTLSVIVSVADTPRFKVSGGKILDPHGNPWIGAGIALYDWNITKGVGTLTTQTAVAQQIMKEFPKINLIRVACYSFDPPASISTFVNAMTSKGVVVVLEDHNAHHTVLTGSALQAESDWYASLAQYYIANPYVLFQSMNEPDINDAYQEQATYNAIRATGSRAIIIMESGSWSGGHVSSMGDTTVFASMLDVAWDLHTYAQGGDTTTTTVNDIFLDQNKRIHDIQTVLSGSGVMPVISLEGGNSVNGYDVDPAWQFQIQANFTNPNLQGFAAWLWTQGYSTINDNLTLPGGLALTSYGQLVASYIAKGLGPVP